MKTKDFDYHLPKNLIAEYPLKNRSDSKLLIFQDEILDKSFKDIINYFKNVFEDKRLAIFLFLGVLIGLFLQELNISSGNTSMFYIFMSGILAFSFFLIPGISGSAMLVVLGVYGPVIQAVAMLHFGLLIPFAMGCLISLLLLPKAILSIYSSHEHNLMHIFSGLILSSGIFLL